MTLLLERVGELGTRVPEAAAIAFVNERGRITESMSRADVVTEMSEVAEFLRQRAAWRPVSERCWCIHPVWTS